MIGDIFLMTEESFSITENHLQIVYKWFLMMTALIFAGNCLCTSVILERLIVEGHMLYQNDRQKIKMALENITT